MSGTHPGATPTPEAPGSVQGILEQKAAAELGHGDDGPKSIVLTGVSWGVGLLSLGALALCAYNVAVRFFYPPGTLELADEVQVYIMVWAVMLSLGAVTVADRHVRADLFVNLFPAPARRAAEVFADLLGLAFSGMLLWFGTLAAYDIYDFGEVSTTSLRFPMWIYVAALPAGALALVVGYLYRVSRHFVRHVPPRG